MPELRTDRLLLRDWRESDLGPWAALNAGAPRRSARRARTQPLPTVATPQEVTFTLDAPGAEHVLLAGDFNEWTLDGSEMHPSDGVWTKVMKLPPGRYRYRYVVDGRWQHDPTNAALPVRVEVGTHRNRVVWFRVTPVWLVDQPDGEPAGAIAAVIASVPSFEARKAWNIIASLGCCVVFGT